jgi:hypothetical protein
MTENNIRRVAGKRLEISDPLSAQALLASP